MKFSKILLFAGLAAIIAFFAPGVEVLAVEGGGTPPASIVGPELWGVIVVDCENNIATLRVKKIEDCVVEKQAEADLDFASCPSTENAALYYQFPVTIDLFSTGKTAVITKVKNWEKEDGKEVYSFDAQIKFVGP